MTLASAVPRRATEADLADLSPLVRAFCEIDGHTFDEVRVESALRPLLADDAYGQVWVLDASGDLCGYAVITWSYSLESGGRDSILDEIYVEHRSGGAGSRLLEAALSGARDGGARAVFLETEAHNRRVRGFYRRHGFEIEDSVWMSRPLLDRTGDVEVLEGGAVAVPKISGLSHVKVPVTDLAVALDWYGRVLGFRPTTEFPDSEGVVRGVHGELPGIGDVLALREDPEAARGLGVFAVANFTVADRPALEAWVSHLDELGVAHGPIGDTPRLSYLVFANPDGQEIHLFAYVDQ